MNNREIAAQFEQVADLLEFQNANPFRVRAYRNGARKIANLAESLTAEGISQDSSSGSGTGCLTDIPGIGKDLAEKIATLLTTGSLPLLDELKAQIPASLITLLRIPGLGPKKVAKLHGELNINSLDELRLACEQQQLRALAGFGAKTEQTILTGIELVERNLSRIRWADAQQIVERLLEHMRGVQVEAQVPEQELFQMEMAGSYRRGRETVGDLDLLVATPTTAIKNATIMDRFGTFAQVAEILLRGDTKMSVRLDCGLQVDLRVVPVESFGAAWQYFTGSQAHNVALRSRAKKRGLKLSEWGVFPNADSAIESDPIESDPIESDPVEGDQTMSPAMAATPATPSTSATPPNALAGQTEEAVYRAIGLPWIPSRTA